MFKAVSTDVSFPKREEQVLQLWEERDVYAKSLARRADAPAFVFYEGPPTANGLPHPGHCLTRAIKDVFPRYKTMQGFRCERKAGWDTHGLPVEVEVGKELGIHSKEEIEAYGIEPFIQRCQQSVWRYMQQWERLTKRLGFWVDLESAYVTYHQSYVESVWWSLKNLFDRGLLYQGHKIVWWWAQGGTALSAGEVGQGYRQVADPSVFVKFPLLDQPQRSLLVWTTTPWTLPSNMYAAVHPDLEYALVSVADSDDQLWIASALVETIATKTKQELTVLETCSGKDLIGLRYRPPFDFFYADKADDRGQLVDGQSEYHYWRVLAADFVTTESGTGLVHQAPAFGEVDYEVLATDQQRFVEGQQPELFHCVAPDGKFTAAAGPFAGLWVKAGDRPIIRDMKERDVLFFQEQYLHDYPFCWRADEDPLIQYPRESWFIRTTQFKDRMLENNAQIGWLPEHIRDGRFGNFLASNVDWALSRERFWGTPLPIWVCQQTGRMEAIGAYEELLDKPGVAGLDVWEKAKAANPDLADDLRVHKPYIDAVTYDSPFAPGARMQRVSEVIDCWYDSGAMPFAQVGYPHQEGSKEKFEGQFPADFISEALDQTRGWFYSQLAISTLLFGPQDGDAPSGGEPPRSDDAATPQPWPHPFRNCIVLGLMMAEWYEPKKSDDKKTIALTEAEAKETFGDDYEKKVGKMSKQLRNYRSPDEIFDLYGADALRWYFFANQPPWTSILYSERTIRDSIPEFLLRLWNVFSFFTIYAEIDEFDPTAGVTHRDGQLSPEELKTGKGYRPPSERAEIDRWILSELHRTIASVTERMDAYDNYGACQQITALVDGLSNWYVRRSRDRYWAKDKNSPDKLDAYWTLYETLVEITKLIAPFVPFLAESLWQELTKPFTDSMETAESVHLCDYPVSDPDRVDVTLSARMELLREIASLGRSARAEAKLKVRQPLASVTVVLPDQQHVQWLKAHDALVQSELNVKAVEYVTDAEHLVHYSVQPNFKRLGPRVGKNIPQVKKLLGEANGGQLMSKLQANGFIELAVGDTTLKLDSEDIQVRLQAHEGSAATQGPNCVVVLSTHVTPELFREGIARDLIRFIQSRRKEMGCDFVDRIVVGILTESSDVKKAVREHQDMIQRETLADAILETRVPGSEPQSLTVAGEDGELSVGKA